MRQSGILLHITSLPSKGGIGTLGKDAYEFVDFLVESGMSVWQVLPVSPTGFGDSPYQSVSSFAGNPLLIDFELLEKDGLTPPDFKWLGEVSDPEMVDYGVVVPQKDALLRKVYAYSGKRLKNEIAAFRKEQTWVEDYALFSAIKQHFGLISWMEWPDQAIRHREEAAMKHYQELLEDEVNYYIFIQYLFYRQWFSLKTYANGKGIDIFGDMPIYCAEDSADVWCAPEMFQLNKNLKPTRVSGCPPDAFSTDGQRWGNPLYNWRNMQKTNFAWWIERLKGMGELYDIIRIDHFIGFANYYSIPAKEKTARIGKWIPAPGRQLFKQVKEQLPNLRVVAEDLGVMSQRVYNLLHYCGYPGMKIMMFGFYGDPASESYPQNFPQNCVVYTGTHDNETLVGFLKQQSEKQINLMKKLLKVETAKQIPDAMLDAGLMSRADMCVYPMQDILELDNSARMNIPSTIGGRNWRWRMLPGAASAKQASRLLKKNILSGRTIR